jgi:uncharacterized membrane protein
MKKIRNLVSTDGHSLEVFANYLFPVIKKYFWVYLMLLGLLYLFITPPWQVPDEPAHYMRAFGISEGTIICEKKGNSTGSMLPLSVLNEINPLAGLVHNERKTSLSETINLLNSSLKLDNETLSKREFFAYNNTALYSPVPYFPQTVGIILSKTMHFSILSSLYISRLMNMLVSIFILYFAIRLISSIPSNLELLFVTLLCVPAFIFEMSSASPDSFTNSIAFLNIALILNLGFTWNRNKFIIYLCTAALLALSKNVYLIIPYSILPIIIFRVENRSMKMCKILWILIFTLIPALIWSKVAMSVFSNVHPFRSVDPHTQLSFFLDHPVKMTGVFISVCFQKIPTLINGYIGKVGWFVATIKYGVLYFPLIILTALFSCKEFQNDFHEKIKRLCYAGIFFITVFMICLSMYLVWTPQSSFSLEGVQGRYFIPLFPLFLLLIANTINIGKSKYSIFFLLVVICINVFQIHSLLYLLNRYYY